MRRGMGPGVIMGTIKTCKGCGLAIHKYSYIKVIQGNYGYGWDDVSTYACRSEGGMTKQERRLLQHDLKEYRASGSGTYRVIKRRELN